MHISECTRNDWTVPFQCVSYIDYKLCLNKAIIKNKTWIQCDQNW